MRKLLSRLQQQRGQVIIMFLGIFSIVTVVAVITLDFGLWFSERRNVQTDVDMAALAGVQELAKDLRADPGGQQDWDWGLAAQGMSFDYLDKNGVDPDNALDPPPRTCPAHDALGDTSVDAFVCADTSCFAGGGDRLLDSVTVDVQAPSRSLFASLFGTNYLEVGAHAKACVGSLTGTTGLRPWAISMFDSPCFEQINGVYIPKFGQDCVLRSDSSNETGSVGIGPKLTDPCDSGSASGSEYETNIIDGSHSWCSIGEVIETIPGFKTGPTKHGLTELFESQGECDSKFGNGDGIDDFREAFTPEDVVPSPDVVYSARDCTTPRAVDIIILDEWDGPRDARPIRGFASFFIQGCQDIKNGNPVGNIDRNCKVGGGDFLIVGKFMNILKLKGTGGALDPFGTRIVFLAE